MTQNLSQLVNSLPEDLLKNRETFNSIINQDLLNKLPQNKLISILNKHLPSNLSNEDKLRTARDLFDNNLNFLNINHMDIFYKQAKIHKFTPDLVKHLNELKLLKKKAYRLEEKKFQCKLFNEIIVKKRILIQKCLQLPDNDESSNNSLSTSPLNENETEIIRRVNERFKKELEEIDSDQINDMTKKQPNNTLLKSDAENSDSITIDYKVDNEEYVKLLKNFKRKKSRNEINADDYKEVSVKQVFDRVMQNPSPNFEKLLTEQKSKNFKKKRKVMIKKSPVNKPSTNVEEFNQSTKTHQLNNVNNTPKPKNSKTNSRENKSVHQSKTNHSKENYESAPASFFSLIRNVFYNDSSNDFKLTLHKLEELVKEKLRHYDPKLGWQSELVQSAMNYLSSALIPPKNIPLVDYKEKNQQWQWIANENCDNDEVLIKLTEAWMTELNKYSLLDPSRPVPPAICKTVWTVKESTQSEKEDYRKQEVIRYENPNKSFTFNLHNYTSIVGPVKGCPAKESSNMAKPKEKTQLLKERPPYVTLLSLVRDSAARLPNGEGTRFDICSLLKDSQYLREDISDEQISAIVSGALDRLHYEQDPCVRYDVNQKKWIYLHRYRTEEDFNRLHKMQIEATLAKKSLQQKVNSSKKSSLNKTTTSTPSTITLPINVSTVNSVSVNSTLTKPINQNVNPMKIEIKDEIDDKISSYKLTSASSVMHTDVNKIRTVNINPVNLIELNQESIMQNTKPCDNQELNQLIVPVTDLNKKELTKKRTTANQTKRPNIVRIKSKSEEGEKTYATTFSNIKSDLINKSIKQKFQKPTTKKLKTEESRNSELKDTNSLMNNDPNKQTSQISQIKIMNATTNNVNNVFALPTVLNSKSSTINKDDANRIVIQQNNGNRINLSTNVIFNSANGPLILSPSNTNINGFASYTLSKKNPPSILIHPQIRILTANNLQQANLSKQQPIVAKIIDSTASNLPTTKIMPKILPAQINISTTSSGSNQSISKSISCRPTR